MPRTRRQGLLIAALAASVVMSALPDRAAAQVMDNHIYSMFLVDQLEVRPVDGQQPIGWQAAGWIGGDFTRFWIKSEGEIATEGRSGRAEAQALYSRLIAPFWEFQVGARVDARRGASSDRARLQAVVGLEGLAPYWFDIEPALFVSTTGDISARIEATHDLYITQRLLLQPRLDFNVAVQAVPEYGVGSGVNDLGLGLRLRYEIRREVAPYIGVRWEQRFAGTADLARAAGEGASSLGLLAGLRFWF
ncbi:MAG: copper resistance protein B [Gemmatimonadota bacterium]